MRNHGPAPIAFVTILVAGLVLSIVALVRPGGDPIALDASAIVDGSAAASIEDRVEEGQPLRSVAVSLLATLRYVLFHDVIGEAVAGRDGWLFTLEEFEQHPDDQQRLRASLDWIARARDALAGDGVHLVVALVPSKARMAADRLSPKWRRLAQSARYEDALDALRATDVPTVDLRPSLDPAACDCAAAPLWFERDTHWTPDGAAAAATAIAQAVRERSIALDPRTEYEVSVHPPVDVLGDLMRFVAVGSFRSVLGLPVEHASTPLAIAADDSGALGLFDTPVIPVALVGTSYSRDERWGFDQSLKAALKADVLNVAEEGEGPFEPMDAYLSGSTYAELRPELVVWEIPERYLTLAEAPQAR